MSEEEIREALSAGQTLKSIVWVIGFNPESGKGFIDCYDGCCFDVLDGLEEAVETAIMYDGWQVEN